MKINEITLNPTMAIPGDPLRFRVGEPVIEGGHEVDKIVYNAFNNLFNKGLEIGFGCYAIYFVGIPERRLINENAVTSAEAVKEVVKKTASDEANVELPE